MNYVVLVLDPLPSDLPEVAEKVAEGLPIPPDKVLKLLQRAPGPVTRAVPERDARKVQSVMQASGLVVEVREGSATGAVVEFETIPAPASTWADAVTTAAEVEALPALVTTDTAVATEPTAASVADASGTATSTEDRESKRTATRPVPPAGQTTTAPPRDPSFTTLVRNPPKLERTGLRRRIVSAATLPALLTLLVTLLAVAITVLPILRQEEQRRVAGVTGAVAATLEGLSGGLPLSAPIVRMELDVVQTRIATTLADQDIDFLLVVDGDEAPVLAWYRGAAGMDAFPLNVQQAALDRAKSVLDGSLAGEEPVSGDWLSSLSTSGRDLMALVGFGGLGATIAAAPVHRLGNVSAAVVAGAEPSGLRQMGAALLTALLVGLVPVLFGILAVLSLTRALRQSINYLLVATDRISHGDFEQSVELERDDELGQIANGVERMRISLRESMERLRQRR